jgi:hypothetical protein
LFFEASEEQEGIIDREIKSFERVTCQLVNLAKSFMFFGSKCDGFNRTNVLQILHVSNTTIEEKFLGLPTLERRMGNERFKTTKARLVKRCFNWAEKNMSVGAKEVLIKSVAQAIPTYVIGMFKFPATTSDEMTQLIGKF